MADITIKWKNEAINEWIDFPVENILCESVEHACLLFSCRVPFVAKEGNCYVVNNRELLNYYRKKVVWVTTFEEILKDKDRCKRPLGIVGFFGRIF